MLKLKIRIKIEDFFNHETYVPIATHKGQYGLLIVKKMIESDSENDIIACVEGIPYSSYSAYLLSILTTSGIGGRGQRMMSFRLWHEN